MEHIGGEMFKILKFLLSVLLLFHIFAACSGITNESNESVREFRYCLRKSGNPNFKKCVGRTVLTYLQRLEEQDNFTFADSVVVARDEGASSRSLVNFLDTDPVDFRGILENAGAVISHRALEFHMDAIYPGLMFKIGPSADSNSVAEFILDPALNERNFNYEEASTARILTKQYVLPFLLGLKFNLVALVPILFAIICLLLKKSLFIAKLVVYVSSILGVGGVAGALGALSGWNGFFGHGHGIGGIQPPQPLGGPIAGGLGLYPGKNTIYSEYLPDQLQHNSPYKRQDRKLVFEKTRGNSRDFSMKGNINVISPTESTSATPVTDHFYEYEKQVLMQDRSGKVRPLNSNFATSIFEEEGDKTAAAFVNVAPNHRFKTSENSGWKVMNIRR